MMDSWVIFAGVIIFLMVFDLGVLHKRDKIMSFSQSLSLSTFYIIIACLFGVYIRYEMGPSHAEEYFTGFLLEKAMSMDNIFVISIVFKFFSIPRQYQHRVLFWGILGVIILRAIMISLGTGLIERFSWILFIFAAFLIYTGVKTLFLSLNHKINIKDMYIYQFFCKYFNVYPRLVGNKFIVRENGIIYITPLFMSLIIIESMDFIFAIDSIPAIFAVTQNTYIIYTSNIFAILGLRALFFCLADIIERFKYIKYSLAIILIFIGIKIFVSHFVYIPAYLTLAITLVLLISGIIVSIIKSKKARKFY